jgi:hypothetical protein
LTPDNYAETGTSLSGRYELGVGPDTIAAETLSKIQIPVSDRAARASLVAMLLALGRARKRKLQYPWLVAQLTCSYRYCRNTFTDMVRGANRHEKKSKMWVINSYEQLMRSSYDAKCTPGFPPWLPSLGGSASGIVLV